MGNVDNIINISNLKQKVLIYDGFGKKGLNKE